MGQSSDIISMKLYNINSSLTLFFRKQYSNGGKINIISIGRHVANRRLRAVLIQGARAYVHKMKEPQSPKDKWLWSLIHRAGYGRAAVALANKNVRTAWALLTQGAVYNKQQGSEWLSA